MLYLAQALRNPEAQAFVRPRLEQGAPGVAPLAPQVVPLAPQMVLVLDHSKFTEASLVMTLIWGAVSEIGGPT